MQNKSEDMSDPSVVKGWCALAFFDTTKVRQFQILHILALDMRHKHFFKIVMVFVQYLQK